MDEKDTDIIPEEDEQYPDDNWAVLADLLREKGAQDLIQKFIAHKRDTAKENHDFQIRKLEAQKESVKRSTRFYWLVSVIVVVAITGLALLGKIDSQVLGALYGAIVGYLFGRLKKE
jgi:hypothetical protein